MSTTEDTTDDLVWRDRDHVFFHDDITAVSAAKFIKCVSEFVNENRELCLELNGNSSPMRPKIFIHVSSNGGCAFSGLMLYDFMVSLKDSLLITTIAEGLCASAATFFFLAGDVRLVRPYAHFLIHQLRSAAEPFVYQTLKDAKEEVYNNERVQGSIRKLYETNTTIPSKKLDILFQSEQYLDSGECDRYGIIANQTQKRKR